MRSAWIVGGTLAAFAVCGACGSSGGTDAPTAADSGIEPVDATPDTSVADANTSPPDCLVGSPSEHPEIVREACGVFVSVSTGADTNKGTRAAPVKTLSSAVALARVRGNPWVFMCQGTYTEAPTIIDRSLGIYAHFDCETWTLGAGQRAILEPKVGREIPLQYKLTRDDQARLEAIEVHAKDAVDTGGSSIAVFVSGGALDVKDSVIRAGNGKDGQRGGDAGAPMPQAAGGNNSVGQNGGNFIDCVCPDGVTRGGHGGTVGLASGNANPGEPDGGGLAPIDGAGGLGGQAICSPNGVGRTGADGRSADAGANAAVPGALTSAGWTPSDGQQAAAGNRAQGGGGGGARNDAGGGGGGCGGCGGAGGLAGGGGGGSICIAAVDAIVSCTSTQLEAGKGGAGGAGSAGQAGQQGGNPGGDTGFNGCTGGNGGKGGNGGPGGGGAGGVVVGVLYKGATAPTLDGTTKFTGGDAGIGGTGGAGARKDGVTQSTLLVN